MSETSGLSPEYNRVGNAVQQFAYIERVGLKMVSEKINKIQDNTTPNRFLFYGPDGIGKRTSLASALEQAVENKNVIFFIPNGLDIRQVRKGKRRYNLGDTRSGGRVERNYFDKNIKKIPHHECRIDTHGQGKILLENFVQHNSENAILETKTTKEYIFTDTIKSEAGITLGELIKANGKQFSNDVFGIIVKEVLSLGKDRPPVFVAINSVNNVFAEKTNISYAMIEDELIDDYSPLKDTKDLNLVQQVKKLLRGDWENGSIVTTVRQRDQIYGYEQTGQYGTTRDSRRRHGFHHEWQLAGGAAVGKPTGPTGCEIIMSDHPIDLLGEEGFREMDPHVPIMEGDFNASQVDTMIAYYQKIGYINFNNVLTEEQQNDTREKEQIQKEFRMLVDRNPEQLLKVAAFY